MKCALILLSLFLTLAVSGQERYKNDPMPKAERDTLPKPYILLEVGENCYCPMMDSLFISIGPNQHRICEVWLKRDFDKLEVIEDKYYENKRPERAWIGQYTVYDFNHWRKF